MTGDITASIWEVFWVGVYVLNQLHSDVTHPNMNTKKQGQDKPNY